ncbi:MAG: hypothetical protein GX493_09765 [Firmicutes bacterium]|nr:hypothetical protein [Bacillota bacterium]
MELFSYLRRFVRLVLLCLLGLVLLKALFNCTPLDVLLLLGLFFVFLVLVCSS